jgi:sugar lactone lactonase YvrE
VRRYVLNLIVPLIAVGFAFAGIVHAQTEANDGGLEPDATCSTTLNGAVIGTEGTLAVAPSGDLFVPEPNAGCVIRIDPAGVGHFAIGGGRRSATCPACGVRLTRPRDVGVGPDGTVYVLDEADSRILAVKPDGTTTTLAGGEQDRYAYRRAITVDSAGRLYFAERRVVYRLDPSGLVPVAGGGGADVGTGAPATSVKLEGVSALAAGPGGTLYIAEESRNRVLRLDQAGTISLFAGTGVNGDNGDGGPATKANIEPEGIAADDAGNVYIAAQFAHRVRRVDPAGQITTFAGRGALTYGQENGDGGPAAQAALTYPTGLAVRDGSLYIFDTYSRSTIRKVDQAGIITTVAGPQR